MFSKTIQYFFWIFAFIA